MPVKTRASKKKKVTSAIEGVSVADVRKCLDYIRRSYKNDESAFHMAIPIEGLEETYTIESFCFEFVKGTHTKRVKK